MTTAYETEAARAAVAAISAILQTLPVAQRPDVVEEAFGGALPTAWADNFKAQFGDDPIPVLLISGEIASDVCEFFSEDTVVADDDGMH
jgi:hypothetical protein